MDKVKLNTSPYRIDEVEDAKNKSTLCEDDNDDHNEKDFSPK